MQTVFVLLAVKLKEISDTKGRRRGASGLLKKKKKKGGWQGMITVSFGIMLNAYSSYGGCVCIFAYSVYSSFLYF